MKTNLIKILFLTKIMFLSMNLIGQTKTLLRTENCDTLTFNIVNQIDTNIWVVEFEFWNRIDTIKYYASEKTGEIISYNTKKELLSKNKYKHENLSPPYLDFYSSMFRIEKENLNINYYGQRFSFPHDYLISRKTYHNNGKVKEEQYFRFGEKTCTIITYDPITYKENKVHEKCLGIIKSGMWKWYDRYGVKTKEENQGN